MRSQIDKLKDAIAAQDKAKNSPPTTPVPVQPTASTPSPQPQAQLTATTPDKPRAVTRKAWFWVSVGASALVVAGVTVGVVLAAQPHGPTASLGQVAGN